jgi:RNA polymerase sigma-70 factor (ECF subfamily)
MDDTTDLDLARRAAGGCEDAAREIVGRFGARILGFLNKRNAGGSNNEDILQETFITAFDRLPSFDPSRSFSAWIFGIARNKASEHFRKSDRIEKLHARAIEDHTAPVTPSQDLDRREQSALFWERARTLLAVEPFECLWLRYQEELSVAEIAETLGKKVSAVKVALFRARKTLAEHLDEFHPRHLQPTDSTRQPN